MIALILQHGYAADIGPSPYKFDYKFDVIYHALNQFINYIRFTKYSIKLSQIFDSVLHA
jgi:hypothetical protein